MKNEIYKNLLRLERLEEIENHAEADYEKDPESAEYDRDEALEGIDASLDSLLEERKPLAEEEISEELYNDILFGFECEEA